MPPSGGHVRPCARGGRCNPPTMAEACEPEYVVGLTWRLGTPLDECQVEQVVERLDMWEPCIVLKEATLDVTVGLDAPDAQAAARTGVRTVTEALLAVDPAGSPEAVEVMTDAAQWVYEPWDL